MKMVLLSLIMLFCLFVLLHLLFPLPGKKPYSQLLLDRNGKVVYTFLSSDEKWRFELAKEEISEKFKEALLYKEDQYFFFHPGINPVSVLRAAWNNFTNGRRTSGASTITRQLARLIEPKERTFKNKLLESFRALQLELSYSKSEILKQYLELVPYGGNIEGVKAASLFYFNKLPDRLSDAEIATLVIIPNRPNSLAPGRNVEVLTKERNKWLKNFADASIFNADETELAIAEPCDGKRLASHQHAQHLSWRVHNANRNSVVKLSIDLQTQHICEKLVHNHIARLKSIGIQNAAVLVVDNTSGKALAYVGSADFNNPEDGGQNDGITAIRSPGSTLKPLLYGLAFDKGSITPKSILADVPMDFGGYAPQNYSGDYAGVVTAEDALAQSLNIPAVNLLEKVSLDNFIKTASRAGLVSLKNQQKRLGLSVILGGCGVSLQELVKLYSGFSNRGEVADVVFTEDEAPGVRQRILSDEAAFLVSESLYKVTRPDFPYGWEYGKDIPKIAWKTGTSYGRRDAWSVGYNQRFTVGVWVGNFSGKGVPELVGSEMAAPLLFNIFENLPASVDEWQQPANLDYRLVCSLSGDIPTDFCESNRIDAFIPGISSNKKCSVESLLRVSADSSVSYCLSCSPPAGYRQKVYLNYPADIASFYEKAGLKDFEKIPVHNPDCQRIFETSKPRITSPVEALTYYVNPEDSTAIKLECQAAAGVQKVHWFVNDRFLQTAPAHKPLFTFLADGQQKITCTDDRGRKKSVTISVEYVSF